MCFAIIMVKDIFFQVFIMEMHELYGVYAFTSDKIQKE